MADGSNIFDEMSVNVRRQNSITKEEVRDEYTEFLKANIFDEICVKVRRQDSSWTKEVRLFDEYCTFLKDNFPHFNERMITVPMSFQYKGVRTHGIVSDDGGRKAGETSKNWIKETSGLRAEQKIFEEIQTQFSDQPCLLMNGFSEQNLFKVMKSKLQQDKNGIQLSKQVTFQKFWLRQEFKESRCGSMCLSGTCSINVSKSSSLSFGSLSGLSQGSLGSL